MTQIQEHLIRRSEKARVALGIPPSPSIDTRDPMLAETFGRREEWWQKPILVCEVGSTAHGTGVDGKEDLDIMGIAIEPFEEVVFGEVRHGSKVYRPGRGPEDRSEPGDLDLSVHTLRKWGRVTMGGNPSFLLMLFAPIREGGPLGRELRTRFAGAFRTKATAAAFLGYAEAQRQRLTGERSGHTPNRPELVEKFGFDTKFAYHMLRLGMQGLEYCIGGSITMPMAADDRKLLLDVRAGAYPLEIVLDMARRNEELLTTLRDRLGPGDFTEFREWVAAVYRAHS